MTEGRIVLAGSLADRGRLRDAIALLERRGDDVQAPGRAPPAPLVHARRPLRAQPATSRGPASCSTAVREHDAAFADVAERLAALG